MNFKKLIQTTLIKNQFFKKYSKKIEYVNSPKGMNLFINNSTKSNWTI
jgi:hypothetical protein